MLTIPEHTTPIQTAIIRIYIYETRDPMEIAKILHYKDPSPVYRVIKQYRETVRQEHPISFSTTILAV